MPLWTPADLAIPPHAWWDFSDPATMTFDESGVNVLTVANKTGVASRDLERIRTWVPGPEFSDTALPGGLPGIYIQSNGEAVSGLRTSLANDFGLNGSSFGVFLSCYVPYRSTSYFQPYFIGQPAGDYNESAPGFNRLFYYPRGDNPPEGAFEGEFGSGINFSSLSAFVGGYVSDTGYREYRVSGGTPKTTTTSPAADWEKIGIPEAPRQDWSYPLDNSSWGEALVLGYTPTTDERQKIEGWMAWKHGCQSTLPADHPYKTAAPQTEGEGITGNAAITLAPAGVASSARLAIRGATARTLAGVARSSTARIRVRANAAQPLGAATASSSGALANRGNLAQQLDSATVIATGEQQVLAPIAAAVSITLESAAVSATATTNAVQPDQPGWTGGGGSHATEAAERRRRTAIRDAIDTARRQIVGEPLSSVADASQPATPIERTASVAEPIQYSALALLEGQGWAVSLSEIAHELEMLRAILIQQQQAEEDDEAAVLALLLAA